MNVFHHPSIELLRDMRFMQLTFFMLLGMMSKALLGETTLVSVFLGLFYLNAMMVTLSATNTHVVTRYVFVLLLIFLMGIKGFPVVGDGVFWHKCDNILTILVLLFCSFKISSYVFFKQKISIDSLFAAAVIYLMIASLFAEFYSLMYLFFPSSLSFPAALSGAGEHVPEITFTYFSFVTLATLGYGDIVPSHPSTQMLASIEAVIGQFYVAVVVARLMSLYAAEKRKSAE